MKKGVLFVLLVFSIQLLLAHSPKQSGISYPPATDTTLNNTKEDKIIDEVIESKKAVKKEKVEYLSQVTKYGFKNLFNNYSYNSALPYSSQVNPYAEKYMQDYLRMHTKYLQGLKTSGRPYFNFIDGILAQHGLPTELKYLAVIESDLKSNALSSAGALGPWQFMDYTARDYGLQVNNWIDERTDYFKSTTAASKYLLSLFKNLQDWLLVIAAYNGGPGRVNQAIRKSGSRNFWKLQYYLPEESRNHVKKFIATHYIMENAPGNDFAGINQFNYNKLSTASPNTSINLWQEESGDLSTTSISGRYKASVIAKSIDMESADFNRFNPNFDKMLSTGANYDLRLPAEKMVIFEEKKYEILNACVQQLLGNVNVDSKTTYGANTKGSVKKH